MCDVCNNESGGTDLGVACIPGVPMSIMWCSECLGRDSAPAFVFEHDLDMVNGDLAGLNEWAKQRVTWANGKYLTLVEYSEEIYRNERNNTAEGEV